MSHNRVVASLVVLVAALMPVCTAADASSRGPTSQLPALTQQLRYGGISLWVPTDWTTYGAAPVVVLHARLDDSDTGTITLEPFSSTRGPDAAALSRYYHGPWKASRSTFGLLLKIGTTVTTLTLGHGTFLFTEYVRIPAYNIGVGLSGPGRSANQALALTRAVLLTARPAPK